MKDTNQKLKAALANIEKTYDDSIIPTLSEYIKIPNKSIMFDKDWKAHGYMDQAMQLIVDWCKKQTIQDMQLELIEAEGRTPLLLIDIPGQSDETVLLYGHMDKQPEMRGWDEDKGPWEPIIQDGKLYGRGGADDGYSTFAALTAIKTLQENDIPHARCVLIIEASEESGSVDLIYYLEQLKDRINTPSLIIALDSGAGNYEQFWSTTSLRGVVGGDLEIRVLNHGMHSGLASGIVPSVFLVLHNILNRIEDRRTGCINIDTLNVAIPSERIEQAQHTANALGTTLLGAYDLTDSTQPVNNDNTELLLNRTWRPSLSITGITGIPSAENAGNVTLPRITFKLSVRIPPTLDVEVAQNTLKEFFESNTPFNAKVTYTPHETGQGWNAPALEDWLKAANENASQLFFGKPSAYFGEGGSIPFMGMLGDMFPKAQFLITGVLGPLSNAHGPNEFLHIDYVKRITGCVASVLASHYSHFSS